MCSHTLINSVHSLPLLSFERQFQAFTFWQDRAEKMRAQAHPPAAATVFEPATARILSYQDGSIIIRPSAILPIRQDVHKQKSLKTLVGTRDYNTVVLGGNPCDMIRYMVYGLCRLATQLYTAAEKKKQNKNL